MPRLQAELALAILAAACIWAAVTILEKPAPPPRYQMIYGGQPGLVYRMDSRSGAMWMCAGASCNAMPWASVPSDPLSAQPKGLPGEAP